MANNTKQLKVGDSIYRVMRGRGVSPLSVSKLTITGQTPQRWKVGNFIQLLKKDLSEYGMSQYSGRGITYQAELTPAQIAQLDKQEKARTISNLLDRVNKDYRDNGDLPELVRKALEAEYEPKEGGNASN